MLMDARLQAMVAATHPDWQPVIRRGLEAVDAAVPEYLPHLMTGTFLPDGGRLFAAFRQPLDSVRYVLVGEGPYPRAASATGVCFMDGAVGSIWSPTGLSKPVNRATSLRNFMKMLLVADGRLSAERTSGDALAGIAELAQVEGSRSISTLAELQENLLANGFLLLNAALVFRPEVPPVKEARAWQPFLQTVLAALAAHAAEREQAAPTLVLWGKIASQIEALPIATQFPKAVAEHPYNLSFITSAPMQALFRPMRLLERQI
jgi:uracil-DNA glycosylase